MMMFNKKGQAAMEFLMTYGWAILVVLIAIGALAYFGVLNPNKLLSDRCTISTGSGLFCSDFASYSTPAPGNVTMVIRNALSDPINIVSVYFNYSNGAYECTNGTGFAYTIQPDTTGTTQLYTTGRGASSCGNGAGAQFTSGAKLKGNIVVTYYQGTSTLVKTTTGSLITTVQ